MGAKIMDQFDSMHSYLDSADMEEATEGLKNIISAKRIAQMFNDEHTEINKENADKVAKKIIDLSKAE